jgi:excisionase family DNA binding protein
MHRKPFLSPADIAQELDVSTATVLRMIHAGALPAIRVSQRIYRIPSATFEMFKAGTLRTAAPAQLRSVKRQPRLGEGEALPKPRPQPRKAGATATR